MPDPHTPVRASAMREHRAIRPIAALGTLAAGLAVVAVGVASLAQDHGQFSAGIGIMLLCYGGLVTAVAIAAWRGVAAVTGAIVAAALLHLAVIVSLATNGAPWLWLASPVVAVTLAAALLLVSRRSSA